MLQLLLFVKGFYVTQTDLDFFYTVLDACISIDHKYYIGLPSEQTNHITHLSPSTDNALYFYLLYLR